MLLRQTLVAATGATGAELIHTTIDGRYQLNPAHVTVDYWSFLSAMADRRTAATIAERAAACRQALTAYRGPLAPDLTAEWADPPRQHATRQAIEAAATRTLATLTDRLAEIDAQPHPSTLELAGATGTVG